MTDRSRTRLVVLQVLVFSLLAALGGRLWYMQVVSGDEYQAAASENRIREVVTPATRGAILDAQGRPLVQNRTSLVVSVDRSTILDLPDDGEKVVRKLANVLDDPLPASSTGQLTLCGSPGAAEPPVCWNGSPYQPIPVAEDVRANVALQVMERSEEFPGVSADMTAIRDYPQPFGARAAQTLGYIGPYRPKSWRPPRPRKAAAAAPTPTSTWSAAAASSRSTTRTCAVDPASRSSPSTRPATSPAPSPSGTPGPGNYLVTSIDAHVQKVVEDQLKAAIERANTAGANGQEQSFPAKTGAAIVMEVDTGRVVAMASYPDYDPGIWVGGVTQQASSSGCRARRPATR